MVLEWVYEDSEFRAHTRGPKDESTLDFGFGQV